MSKKSINPNFKKGQSNTETIGELLTKIKNGDRYALSKAITLIESSQQEDKASIAELLSHTTSASSSKRIAITGSPGAGKSTCIEALGQHLINQHKKVAILAIDPSSTQSKGSILGDKTRMEILSKNENAFIRPSASGGTLGGVAHMTKNTIALCEMAGYDTILIETVGVGQSEVEVYDLVDLMILVALPGAGDEIQGIKRGIMELADIIVINKADGNRIDLAKASKRAFENSLHLLQPKSSEWVAAVTLTSALHNNGIDILNSQIEEYFKLVFSNGHLDKNRLLQNQKWYNIYLEKMILEEFRNRHNVQDLYSKDEVTSNIDDNAYYRAYSAFSKYKAST